MEFYFNEEWETPKSDILKVFDSLDDEFLILNKSENKYMQLICIEGNYTVEIRDFFNEYILRQYRIGRTPAINVWHYLGSKSGLIALKKSEILSKQDTRKILYNYLEGKELDINFYKRNISREIGLKNQ